MRAKNVARLLAHRKASPSISQAEDSDGKGNPRCWQETRTTCRCAGSVPLSSLNRERRPETSCQSRSPSSHHSQDRPTTSREAEIRPGRKTTLPPPEQGVPPRTPQLLSAVLDTPSTRSPWKMRQRVHSPRPCIMMHPLEVLGIGPSGQALTLGNAPKLVCRAPTRGSQAYPKVSDEHSEAQTQRP